MEIPKDIKKAHLNLSPLSLRFIDYARQNPDILRAYNYSLLELNDPLIKLQPWPTFIDEQNRINMENASREVFNLIKSIPARFFSNNPEKISQFYGINRELANYFLYGLTQHHLDSLLSRADLILTTSGPKCLEFNINTNLGGMDLSMWESRYLGTPVIADFFEKHQVKILNNNLFSVLFDHLVNSAADFYTGNGDINITVVFPQEMEEAELNTMEDYYDSILNWVLATRGSTFRSKVILCTYDSMEVSGDDIYCKGKKIHTILEWCQGYVPDNILEIFKKGKILICNGAVSFLLSTKLNLVLLSQNIDSNIFTPEEKKIIEKYIPWTRRVVRGETTYEGKSIKMEEFLITHREKLVLKPSLGSGGKGIYIGRHTEPEEWRKQVEIALIGEDWRHILLQKPITENKWLEFASRAGQVRNWCVQEYMESPTYLYQLGENGCAEHHIVWGIFIFGETYAGGFTRVMPTENTRGVINSHQGAKISVIFEV